MRGQRELGCAFASPHHPTQVNDLHREHTGSEVRGACNKARTVACTGSCWVLGYISFPAACSRMLQGV